ncbi:MAG: hypothetical protein ACFFFG_12920 [Candidatus Thorarchaeota archaeon]
MVVSRVQSLYVYYKLHITNYEDSKVSRKKKSEKSGDDPGMECVVYVGDAQTGGLKGNVKGKILEAIETSLEKLEGRNNVVLTRLDDSTMHQLDALIEIGLFKSKSEAVAFFCHEGIAAKRDLFDKIMPTVEKIRELKEQAKQNL